MRVPKLEQSSQKCIVEEPAWPYANRSNPVKASQTNRFNWIAGPMKAYLQDGDYHSY